MFEIVLMLILKQFETINWNNNNAEKKQQSKLIKRGEQLEQAVDC